MEDNKETVRCGCGYGEGNNHIVGKGTCARYHVTNPDEIPRNRREVYNPEINKEPVFMWDIKNYSITEYTLLSQRMYNQDENGNWTRPKSKESRNSLEGNW